MADISLHRTHSVGLEDARGKMEVLLNGFRERKPDLVKDVNWSGNTGVASGKYFKGSFTVTDTDVNVEVTLIGFAAKMVKGMVREQISRQLDRGGFPE